MTMQMLLAWAVPMLFFAAVVASGWYVGRRLQVHFSWARGRLLPIASTAVVLASTIGMGVLATPASHIAGAIYVGAGYLFGFFLFLLLFLLVAHPMAALLPKARALIGGVAVAGAFITAGYAAWNATVVRVVPIDLPMRGLATPVRIVQISDAHIGHHRGREYLQALVAATNEQRPDVVVITGDLLDSNVAIRDRMLTPLGALTAPALYVEGNHEGYIDRDSALAAIEDTGVRVLHNEDVTLAGLRFVGLDYMRADNETLDLHPSADPRTIQGTMQRFVAGVGAPMVVLHHSPVGVDYVAQSGAALMMSGHTHGGQVFPATWLARWIFPYNAGRYQNGPMTVFVSQGAGTFMLPLRLGTNNELNLIVLQPE